MSLIHTVHLINVLFGQQQNIKAAEMEVRPVALEPDRIEARIARDGAVWRNTTIADQAWRAAHASATESGHQLE